VKLKAKPSVTAKSTLLSPLRSAPNTLLGASARNTAEKLKPGPLTDVEIKKNAALEAGPPLVTVTMALPADATSEARICAFSCDWLTNVVTRALPFHFTTELETKPVPFTVRVKVALPGATVAGSSG
jgi:hypothetical protein